MTTKQSELLLLKKALYVTVRDAEQSFFCKDVTFIARIATTRAHGIRTAAQNTTSMICVLKSEPKAAATN